MVADGTGEDALDPKGLLQTSYEHNVNLLKHKLCSVAEVLTELVKRFL